tara:strand:- start:508 stop:1008 length:501 start_codon:yes stop_codon:yes gene_type:complete
MDDIIFEILLFLFIVILWIVYAIIVFIYKTTKKVITKTVKIIRPHEALIDLANDPDNDELVNHSINDDSSDWIDKQCRNNKKLCDKNGNIVVIGSPSSKIDLTATYDSDGNLIARSNLKASSGSRKVIFMDPEDKKDEEGKLKKLYQEGYISKSTYNSMLKELENK